MSTTNTTNNTTYQQLMNKTKQEKTNVFRTMIIETSNLDECQVSQGIVVMDPNNPRMVKSDGIRYAQLELKKKTHSIRQ